MRNHPRAGGTDPVVTFREPWTHDPLIAALEELRTVDRLLAGVEVVARSSTPNFGPFAALTRLEFSTPLPTCAAVEATQDEHDARIAEALRHLQRAVELTGGHLWSAGVAADGTAWALNSSVGLRRAARDYFEALVADDRERLGEVAPLTALEPVRPPWYVSVGSVVLMMTLVAVAAVAWMLALGVPPLGFALIPLVAALLWIRDRSRRRLGASR